MKPRRGAPIHPLYLQVAPPDIAEVKFVFESYEGVAVVRTLDRRAATIVVLVVEDFLAAARAVIAELQDRLGCALIDAPAAARDDWLLAGLDE